MTIFWPTGNPKFKPESNPAVVIDPDVVAGQLAGLGLSAGKHAHVIPVVGTNDAFVVCTSDRVMFFRAICPILVTVRLYATTSPG